MDALDRMFLRLTEDLRRAPRPGPLTVAELYQARIPYRLARAELGFAELAAYEHALLRLLAGERGYARLADPQVTDELTRELRSPNPILGIYRDYPDVVVQLRSPTASPGPPDSPAAPEAVTQEVPPPVVEAAARCPSCAVVLPRPEVARFCPACGVGLRPAPCRECGTELEPAWMFCIECGTERRRRAQ